MSKRGRDEKRDEHREPEESVALDLTRLKGGALRGAHLAQRVLRAPGEAAAVYTSVLRITIGQLAKSRLARAGALVVSCLALIAIFADVLASDRPIACHVHGTTYMMPNVTDAPALASYDNARIAAEAGPGDWAIYPLVRFGPASPHDAAAALRAPSLSGGHFLGTDAQGRDVFARIVHGTRTALTVGMMAVIAFAGIGTILGALAGFFGGVMDSIVARLVETLTAFPTIVLVLVVQAVLPNPTIYTMLLTIGLTRWTEVARLVRAEVLLISAQDYVTAARALGASPSRVLRRHVLPNALAPAFVTSAFGIASVILIETSLEFLRVGLPNAQAASWGEILSEARGHDGAWWLVVFPGAIVFVTVAALNLVGEALRDALDPRLRDANRVAEATRAARPSRDTVVPPSVTAFDDSTHA